MSFVLAHTKPDQGWMRTEKWYEPLFLYGTVLCALLAYVFVASGVVPFVWMMMVYMVVFAHPHFFSTYTRTAFQKSDFQNYKKLNFGLPFLVFAALLGLYQVFGIWIYFSLYMYVQWFHFTRQSYGISRFYQATSPQGVTDGRLTTWLIYLIPIWGIVQWSVKSPETYIGQPVKTFDILSLVDPVLGWICAGVFAVWALGRMAQWRRGQMPLAHTVYVLIHCFMFLLSYVLIETIEYGWMTLGIWHSAQYCFFVWSMNEKQYGGGKAKTKKPLHQKQEKSFLQNLSSSGRAGVYAMVVFVMALLFFGLVEGLAGAFEGVFFIPAIILTGTVVFHHYIVDAIIWRRRKQKS